MYAVSTERRDFHHFCKRYVNSYQNNSVAYAAKSAKHPQHPNIARTIPILEWPLHENDKKSLQPHSQQTCLSQETYLPPQLTQHHHTHLQVSPKYPLHKEPVYSRQITSNILLPTLTSNVLLPKVTMILISIVRDRATRLRNHYNLLASTLRIRGEARMSRVPSHLRGIKIKELREMQKRGITREKQLLTDVLGTRLLASTNRPMLKR